MGDMNGESIDPEEEFNPDKIPTKILMANIRISDPPSTIAVYHPAASYSLRKTLIDQGRKSFKELEKVDFS